MMSVFYIIVYFCFTGINLYVEIILNAIYYCSYEEVSKSNETGCIVQKYAHLFSQFVDGIFQSSPHEST